MMQKAPTGTFCIPFALYYLLHVDLPLLMLQICRTGIVFIYTVRLVGDGWDESEVERSFSWIRQKDEKFPHRPPL